VIAHLGMYEMGHTRAATRALWSAIRAQLGYGPEQLTEATDFWAVWRDPDLLLSQTCGYPFRAELRGQVQLVGTPDYGLPSCAAGEYYSVVIAQRDDTRAALAEFEGASFAYNEPLSQSGWAAPMAMFAEIANSFAALLQTGSHVGSLCAVAEGRAELAALDAVTWRLLQIELPDLSAQVRVIAHTDPSPGLPLITGLRTNASEIADAVRLAIAGLEPEVKDVLGLQDLVQIPAVRYLSVPTPPPPGAFLASKTYV